MALTSQKEITREQESKEKIIPLWSQSQKDTDLTFTSRTKYRTKNRLDEKTRGYTEEKAES